MRKLLIILPILLTFSCVDILHYLGKDGEKTYTYVKVSLSRSLVDMLSTLNGQTNSAVNQYLISSQKELMEALEGDIEFHFDGLNDSSDMGFELKISQDGLDKTDSKKAPFSPYREAQKIIIPLPTGFYDRGSMNDEQFSTFIQSARYRLILSESLVPDLRIAELHADGEQYNIVSTVLNDVTLLTVPISPWIKASNECSLHLLY